MKKIDPPKSPENLPSEEERAKELEKSKTPEFLKKLARRIADMRDLDDEVEEDQPEEE